MKLTKNIPIPFFVLLFLFMFSALTINNYLHPLNIYNITRQASVLALVAIGQCIVILLGGIDLSQGSVMGFTAVCTAFDSADRNSFYPGSYSGVWRLHLFADSLTEP